MIKKWVFIFLLAFFLNIVWEILHSFLYASYRGTEITLFILFRAALADGAMILALVWLAEKFGKYDNLVLIVGGLALAVVIEMWALSTGRWQYNSLMPIIPVLRVGLTPVVQLALTGYIVKYYLKV